LNLTFASVCTGIGAPEVAWTPLGWRPQWFAEIEPFPSSVLAHHWPRVPNLGDMTKLASYVRAGIVTAPDVLVGGTPCQAFSVAGLRAGLADPRGQLTLAYVDLANAIDEKRPAGDECVVVWENVPGVLSDKSNAFGCFLGLLAGEDDALVPPGERWPNAGVVYGPQRAIAWRVLDAQYFGVAQRRRRVFVISSARNGFDPASILFEPDGVRRDSPPLREKEQDFAPTLTGGARGRGGYSLDDAPLVAGTLRSSDGGADLDHARAGHILACVSNAEGATGLPFLTCSNIGKTVNNQTPLLAFSCKDYGGDASVDLAPTLRAMGHGATHANGGGGQLAVAQCVTGQITHALKAEGADASEDGTGRGNPIVPVVYSFKPGQSEAAGGIFVTEDYAPTLQAQNNGSTAVPAVAYPDTVGALCAHSYTGGMGGRPEGAVAGHVLPVLGFHTNAQPDQMRFDPHTAAALTCSQIPGVLQQLQRRWRVRRLTPRECE
jgi:DNA (cytosine-5)-methyltransferase 1